uniref:Uncharacterized protein n=1 Tax=Chromera velia CCMP2878 TaxID=1169474 RepID=A0A0G4HK64_9ALVE|eukprot:Cvel_1105.t1-p1 / transcript=Cvel_1105.t1 / gene=Cvel_1105 / organism=Chromera_velia_CCMP2878 / gene_product=hypothetical protein / transcript_product=hypothetical protein / location=Cvel_scaffold36:41494-53787(-) / protein_length=3035 / sequence_SO=supercontig / SO=protein_coding / is_pseudo=false
MSRHSSKGTRPGRWVACILDYKYIDRINSGTRSHGNEDPKVQERKFPRLELVAFLVTPEGGVSSVISRLHPGFEAPSSRYRSLVVGEEGGELDLPPVYFESETAESKLQVVWCDVERLREEGKGIVLGLIANDDFAIDRTAFSSSSSSSSSAEKNEETGGPGQGNDLGCRRRGSSVAASLETACSALESFDAYVREDSRESSTGGNNQNGKSGRQHQKEGEEREAADPTPALFHLPLESFQQICRSLQRRRQQTNEVSGASSNKGGISFCNALLLTALLPTRAAHTESRSRLSASLFSLWEVEELIVPLQIGVNSDPLLRDQSGTSRELRGSRSRSRDMLLFHQKELIEELRKKVQVALCPPASIENNPKEQTQKHRREGRELHGMKCRGRRREQKTGRGRARRVEDLDLLSFRSSDASRAPSSPNSHSPHGDHGRRDPRKGGRGRSSLLPSSSSRLSVCAVKNQATIDGQGRRGRDPGDDLRKGDHRTPGQPVPLIHAQQSKKPFGAERHYSITPLNVSLEDADAELVPLEKRKLFRHFQRSSVPMVASPPPMSVEEHDLWAGGGVEEWVQAGGLTSVSRVAAVDDFEDWSSDEGETGGVVSSAAVLLQEEGGRERGSGGDYFDEETNGLMLIRQSEAAEFTPEASFSDSDSDANREKQKTKTENQPQSKQEHDAEKNKNETKASKTIEASVDAMRRDVALQTSTEKLGIGRTSSLSLSNGSAYLPFGTLQDLPKTPPLPRPITPPPAATGVKPTSLSTIQAIAETQSQKTLQASMSAPIRTVQSSPPAPPPVQTILAPPLISVAMPVTASLLHKQRPLSPADRLPIQRMIKKSDSPPKSQPEKSDSPNRILEYPPNAPPNRVTTVAAQSRSPIGVTTASTGSAGGPFNSLFMGGSSKVPSQLLRAAITSSPHTGGGSGPLERERSPSFAGWPLSPFPYSPLYFQQGASALQMKGGGHGVGPSLRGPLGGVGYPGKSREVRGEGREGEDILEEGGGGDNDNGEGEGARRVLHQMLEEILKQRDEEQHAQRKMPREESPQSIRTVADSETKQTDRWTTLLKLANQEVKKEKAKKAEEEKAEGEKRRIEEESKIAKRVCKDWARFAALTHHRKRVSVCRFFSTFTRAYVKRLEEAKEREREEAVQLNRWEIIISHLCRCELHHRILKVSQTLRSLHRSLRASLPIPLESLKVPNRERASRDATIDNDSLGGEIIRGGGRTNTHNTKVATVHDLQVYAEGGQRVEDEPPPYENENGDERKETEAFGYPLVDLEGFHPISAEGRRGEQEGILEAKEFKFDQKGRGFPEKHTGSGNHHAGGKTKDSKGWSRDTQTHNRAKEDPKSNRRSLRSAKLLHLLDSFHPSASSLPPLELLAPCTFLEGRTSPPSLHPMTAPPSVWPAWGAQNAARGEQDAPGLQQRSASISSGSANAAILRFIGTLERKKERHFPRESQTPIQMRARDQEDTLELRSPSEKTPTQTMRRQGSSGALQKKPSRTLSSVFFSGFEMLDENEERGDEKEEGGELLSPTARLQRKADRSVERALTASLTLKGRQGGGKLGVKTLTQDSSVTPAELRHSHSLSRPHSLSRLPSQVASSAPGVSPSPAAVRGPSPSRSSSRLFRAPSRSSSRLHTEGEDGIGDVEKERRRVYKETYAEEEEQDLPENAQDQPGLEDSEEETGVHSHPSRFYLEDSPRSPSPTRSRSREMVARSAKTRSVSRRRERETSRTPLRDKSGTSPLSAGSRTPRGTRPKTKMKRGASLAEKVRAKAEEKIRAREREKRRQMREAADARKSPSPVRSPSAGHPRTRGTTPTGQRISSPKRGLTRTTSNASVSRSPSRADSTRSLRSDAGGSRKGPQQVKGAKAPLSTSRSSPKSSRKSPQRKQVEKAERASRSRRIYEERDLGSSEEADLDGLSDLDGSASSGVGIVRAPPSPEGAPPSIDPRALFNSSSSSSYLPELQQHKIRGGRIENEREVTDRFIHSTESFLVEEGGVMVVREKEKEKNRSLVERYAHSDASPSANQSHHGPDPGRIPSEAVSLALSQGQQPTEATDPRMMTPPKRERHRGRGADKERRLDRRDRRLEEEDRSKTRPDEENDETITAEADDDAKSGKKEKEKDAREDQAPSASITAAAAAEAPITKSASSASASSQGEQSRTLTPHQEDKEKSDKNVNSPSRPLAAEGRASFHNTALDPPSRPSTVVASVPPGTPHQTDDTSAAASASLVAALLSRVASLQPNQMQMGGETSTVQTLRTPQTQTRQGSIRPPSHSEMERLREGERDTSRCQTVCTSASQDSSETAQLQTVAENAATAVVKALLQGALALPSSGPVGDTLPAAMIRSLTQTISEAVPEADTRKQSTDTDVEAPIEKKSDTPTAPSREAPQNDSFQRGLSHAPPPHPQSSHQSLTPSVPTASPPLSTLDNRRFSAPCRPGTITTLRCPGPVSFQNRRGSEPSPVHNREGPSDLGGRIVSRGLGGRIVSRGLGAHPPSHSSSGERSTSTGRINQGPAEEPSPGATGTQRGFAQDGPLQYNTGLQTQQRNSQFFPPSSSSIQPPHQSNQQNEATNVSSNSLQGFQSQQQPRTHSALGPTNRADKNAPPSSHSSQKTSGPFDRVPNFLPLPNITRDPTQSQGKETQADATRPLEPHAGDSRAAREEKVEASDTRSSFQPPPRGEKGGSAASSSNSLSVSGQTDGRSIGGSPEVNPSGDEWRRPEALLAAVCDQRIGEEFAEFPTRAVLQVMRTALTERDASAFRNRIRSAASVCSPDGGKGGRLNEDEMEMARGVATIQRSMEAAFEESKPDVPEIVRLPIVPVVHLLRAACKDSRLKHQKGMGLRGVPPAWCDSGRSTSNPKKRVPFQRVEALLEDRLGDMSTRLEDIENGFELLFQSGNPGRDKRRGGALQATSMEELRDDVDRAWGGGERALLRMSAEVFRLKDRLESGGGGGAGPAVWSLPSDCRRGIGNLDATSGGFGASTCQGRMAIQAPPMWTPGQALQMGSKGKRDGVGGRKKGGGQPGSSVLVPKPAFRSHCSLPWGT